LAKGEADHLSIQKERDRFRDISFLSLSKKERYDI